MRSTDSRIPVQGVGFSLLLVGIWGGLVPFVGPLFHFSMGSGGAWVWSESHATLHVAPAAVSVVGALLILLSNRRGSQVVGGILATLGGIWFVIGPTLHPLWAAPVKAAMKMAMGGSGATASAGSGSMSPLEGLGYHYGVGIVIAVLAAYALGRLARRREVVARGPVVASAPVSQEVRDQEALVEA